MSHPITYDDLADLYESIRGPFAASTIVMRDAAKAERTTDREDLAEIIEDILSEVPVSATMPKSTKHNGTCYFEHAPCLAEYIRGEL